MICRDSINETFVIGREISQKTFSGKKIDYNIPEIHYTPTSINAVKKALMDSMQDYDDVALLLSGGKDSRMLACLLKELGKKPVCYTYIGRDTKYEKNELRVAKKVAEILGFEHKTINIDWDNYYQREMIPKIMKATDGMPIFQTVLTMTYVRPKIPEDMLITGDLVTEFLDTAEYRPWKDGKNIKKVLFNREKIINTTDNYKSIIKKLRDIYKKILINDLLLLRRSDRIVRAQVYKKLGFKVLHPAFDTDVLQKTCSLPIKERTDGFLPRTIIKESNRELYKFRTARSPFSLRYPLSFHMAYGKIMGTGVNNTPIIGSFDSQVADIESIQKRYRADNHAWWRSLNG